MEKKSLFERLYLILGTCLILTMGGIVGFNFSNTARMFGNNIVQNVDASNSKESTKTPTPGDSGQEFKTFKYSREIDPVEVKKEPKKISPTSAPTSVPTITSTPAAKYLKCVEIINYTGIKKLAEGVRQVLEESGYEVSAGNGTSLKPVTTTIIDYGDKNVGQEIKEILKMGNIKKELSENSRFVATIILGDDFDPVKTHNTIGLVIDMDNIANDNVQSIGKTNHRISFDGGYVWAGCIITHMDDETTNAKVFIPTDVFNKHFTKKDKAIIKYLENNIETIFYGCVEPKLSSVYTRVLSIKINKKVEVENIRKYTRYSVDYKCLITQHNKVYDAKLADISLGGIGVVLDYDLSMTSGVYIDIFVKGNRRIRFLGSLVRKISPQYIRQQPKYQKDSLLAMRNSSIIRNIVDDENAQIGYQSLSDKFRYGIEIKSIDDQNMNLLDEFLTTISLGHMRIFSEQKFVNIVRNILQGLAILIVYGMVILTYK